MGLCLLLALLAQAHQVRAADAPAKFVFRGSFYPYGFFGAGSPLLSFGPTENSYGISYEFPDGGATDRSIQSTISLVAAQGAVGVTLTNEALLTAPRLAGNDHGGGFTVVADVYVHGPPGTPYFLVRALNGSVTAVRGGGAGTTQAHAAGTTAVINNGSGAQMKPVSLVSGSQFAGVTSNTPHPSAPGYYLAASVSLPLWGFTYQSIDFCFPGCPQPLNFRSTSTLSGIVQAGPCCPLTPELDDWNSWPEVDGNNCYNYATNRFSQLYTRNQPGDLLPNLPEYTCELVANAVADEGFVPTTFPEPNGCGAGQCVVALFVAPPGVNRGDSDYHWYRRSLDGLWAHKPGGGLARTTADPLQDDRTWPWPDGTRTPGYSQFCGYFCIPCEFALRPEPSRPSESIAVTGLLAQVAFFSGRENPGWSISDSLEIAEIREMVLAGAPTAPDTTRGGVGYGGISLVAGQDVPSMPDLIRVSNGVVAISDSGLVEFRTDDLGLEQYLIQRAISAGFAAYVPSPTTTAPPSASARVLELVLGPNPASGTAAARFEVPVRGRVRIDLFDVAGRHVLQILDEVREAGVGYARVDVSRVPRGVYLLRMRSEGGAATQRLSIVR